MKHLIGLLLLSLFLFGCATPKSFVDKRYSSAKYSDIVKKAEPYKLKFTVMFQRNGENFPQVNAELLGHVERTLRATGVIVPASDAADGEITIVMNNIADMQQAYAKGFATGLTFGIAESTVTDFYEMKATIKLNNQTAYHQNYKHAIHTTVGSSSMESHPGAISPTAAFGKVMEDLLLNFVRDSQQSGILSRFEGFTIPAYHQRNLHKLMLTNR